MRFLATSRSPVVHPPARRDGLPALEVQAFGAGTWAVLSPGATTALEAGEIVGTAQARSDGRFDVRFPGEDCQPTTFASLDRCLEYFDEYVFALHLGR